MFTMLRWLTDLRRSVADYTVGTVIVMVHMATVDWRNRRLALQTR